MRRHSCDGRADLAVQQTVEEPITDVQARAADAMPDWPSRRSRDFVGDLATGASSAVAGRHRAARVSEGIRNAVGGGDQGSGAAYFDFGVIFLILLPWRPRPAMRPFWLKIKA